MIASRISRILNYSLVLSKNPVYYFRIRIRDVEDLRSHVTREPEFSDEEYQLEAQLIANTGHLLI